MNKHFPILAILLSVFVLFSCDSKRTEEGDLLFGLDDGSVTDDPSTPTGEHTKLLKSYTFTDVDGEITSATYTYNGTNLISSTFTEDGETTDFKVIYNGSQISNIEMTYNDGSSISTGSFALEYSGTQLISSKGMFEDEGTLTQIENEFGYDDGKLSAIQTKYITEDPGNPDANITVMQLNSTLNFTANNIGFWKLTTTYPESPIALPDVVLETTFSDFDSNKNPFNTLPEIFTIATAHFTVSSNSIIGLSKNNFKNISVLVMGTNNVAELNYEYDGEGYPTKATSALGTFTYEYIPR